MENARESIEERKRMNEIVCRLVVGNMENGNTYERAKELAFNRLERDYPDVLRYWLGR